MKVRSVHIFLGVILVSHIVIAYPQLDDSTLDDSSILASSSTNTDNPHDSNLDLPDFDPSNSELTDPDESSIFDVGSASSDLSNSEIKYPDTPFNLDLDTKASSTPNLDLASLDNSNGCESSVEDIDSSLSESDDSVSPDDSSVSKSSDAMDITKRLVKPKNSNACPNPNKQPASPPSSPGNPRPIMNGVGTGCRVDPKTNRCEAAVAMLVYSKTCKATGDNHLVTLELIKMIGSSARLHISQIKGCGVFFWYTKLRPSQVSHLVKFRGVRGIAPDGKIEHYGKTGNQASSKTPVKAGSRHRLRKRDSVVTRLNQGKDLAYISTAPNTRGDPLKYTYFRSAGQATIEGTQRRAVSYVIGDGVAEDNVDLRRTSTVFGSRTSVVSWWLYARGVVRQKTIEAQVRDLTTCSISKIAGSNFGVANEGEVVMVKVLNEISSFLDGLVEIINDLRSASRDMAGFTVVSIEHGWKQQGSSQINLLAMKQLLKTLESLGVVIVCAAGKVDQGSETQDDPALKYVSTFPARWSQEPGMSIITVGSIHQYTEQIPYWSPIGSAVTISAPGFCDCATSDPRNPVTKALGTSVSSSIVVGMLLAFAALEDVGPKLRAYQNIPRAFKAYLLRKAYVRQGGSVLTAWNGLSSEMTSQWIPDADDLVENDGPPDGGSL